MQALTVAAASLVLMVIPISLSYGSPSFYEKAANNKQVFLLACLTFPIDNGPVQIPGAENFDSMFHTDKMPAEDRYFFWVLANKGYKNIHDIFLGSCVNRFRERFDVNNKDELDKYVAAVELMLVPALNRLDEHAKAQCEETSKSNPDKTYIIKACEYAFPSESKK